MEIYNTLTSREEEFRQAVYLGEPPLNEFENPEMVAVDIEELQVFEEPEDLEMPYGEDHQSLAIALAIQSEIQKAYTDSWQELINTPGWD